MPALRPLYIPQRQDTWAFVSAPGSGAGAEQLLSGRTRLCGLGGKREQPEGIIAFRRHMTNHSPPSLGSQCAPGTALAPLAVGCHLMLQSVIKVGVLSASGKLRGQVRGCRLLMSTKSAPVRGWLTPACALQARPCAGPGACPRVSLTTVRWGGQRFTGRRRKLGGYTARSVVPKSPSVQEQTVPIVWSRGG